MERLKPYRNRQYQQLHDSHLESHDHNIDDCHEKESLNIGNGLEVAIVDGDYKPTFDSHLSSFNEENNYIGNNLYASNRLLSSQDDYYVTNGIQIVDKSSVESSEKDIHCVQEVNYDFLGKTNTDLWKEKAKVEKQIELDENHEKVSHCLREISYDFFGENNVDSWDDKAKVEKIAYGNEKNFEFNISHDIIPSHMIVSPQQFYNKSNEISIELNPKKNIDNLHDSSLSKWSPNSKEKTTNYTSKSNYNTTNSIQANIPQRLKFDMLEIEGDVPNNSMASTSQISSELNNDECNLRKDKNKESFKIEMQNLHGKHLYPSPLNNFVVDWTLYNSINGLAKFFFFFFFFLWMNNLMKNLLLQILNPLAFK